MVIERQRGVLDGLGFGTTQPGFKSTLSHLRKLPRSSEPHFLYLRSGDNKAPRSTWHRRLTEEELAAGLHHMGSRGSLNS